MSSNVSAKCLDVTIELLVHKPLKQGNQTSPSSCHSRNTFTLLMRLPNGTIANTWGVFLDDTDTIWGTYNLPVDPTRTQLNDRTRTVIARLSLGSIHMRNECVNAESVKKVTDDLDAYSTQKLEELKRKHLPLLHPTLDLDWMQQMLMLLKSKYGFNPKVGNPLASLASIFPQWALSVDGYLLSKPSSST